MKTRSYRYRDSQQSAKFDASILASFVPAFYALFGLVNNRLLLRNVGDDQDAKKMICLQHFNSTTRNIGESSEQAKKNDDPVGSAVQILALTLLAGCDPKSPVSFCHATGDLANPYEEIAVDNIPANEHPGHANDTCPVPEGGCPTIPLEIGNGKIAICLATGSETNPYNEITVRVNGMNGHGSMQTTLFPHRRVTSRPQNNKPDSNTAC